MFMTFYVAYIVVSKINIILGLEYLQKRGAVMVLIPYSFEKPNNCMTFPKKHTTI